MEVVISYCGLHWECPPVVQCNMCPFFNVCVCVCVCVCARIYIYVPNENKRPDHPFQYPHIIYASRVFEARFEKKRDDSAIVNV